jgi:hypothetical protein
MQEGEERILAMISGLKRAVTTSLLSGWEFELNTLDGLATAREYLKAREMEVGYLIDLMELRVVLFTPIPTAIPLGDAGGAAGGEGKSEGDGEKVVDIPPEKG